MTLDLAGLLSQLTTFSFIQLNIFPLFSLQFSLTGVRKRKNKPNKPIYPSPIALSFAFLRLKLTTEELIASQMFRNRYDTNVASWSPSGRLLQVEYAMEAVKLGSAAIGLRSKTHVVLACVNKAISELSSHRMKIIKVDDHIGVAVAGFAADGRVLSRYMRDECINYSYKYDSPLPVGRLVVKLADKAQVCTQQSGKRPYGVGLLVGGLDESGAHLYYNCPSGNYFEYQAFAMGSRSQAAESYLEQKFDTFVDSSRDNLIKDALFALRGTLQGEKLTSSICMVSVMGLGEAYHILDQETVQGQIDEFEIAGEEPPAGEELLVRLMRETQLTKEQLEWFSDYLFYSLLHVLR